MSMTPYLYESEKPLRLMKREFLQPEDYFGNPPVNRMMPRDGHPTQYTLPWVSMSPMGNTARPMEQLSAAVNQMALPGGSKITADKEKFQINVDVQHFTPEEIAVKVVNGDVVVAARHEEKRDGHGYVARQFVRRYALPKGCLPDTVESKLSSDGVLTVIAPRVLPLPSVGEKIVPITLTGPVQKRF